MLKLIVDNRLDLVVFGVISAGAMAALHLYLKLRLPEKKGVSPVKWFLLSLILGGVFLMTEHAAQAQKNGLQKMLQGIAPTYALEMALLGHERIGLNTAADDPHYLSLIEREKRWLAINHEVNDIYTFGKNAEGQVVLLVDSETDYDHNGKFEGEREGRTIIGEVYPEADKVLLRAFEGTPSFNSEPYTDRWGTWVSAYEPLRDASGRVTAVLGVDYAASAWLRSVAGARLAMFGFAAILVVVLLSVAGLLAMIRSQMSRQGRDAEHIRRSEKLFRVLGESAPIGIYRTDAEGRCVYTNLRWQAIAGMALEESLGAGWAAAVHPEDRKKVVEAWEGTVEKNREFSLEFRFLHRDGEVRWVDSRAICLLDDKGARAGFIGTNHDITDRKKLENQLLQAQKMETVGTLAGGIAHDLNNQLTPLTGYLTLMKTEVDSSHPFHPMLLEACTAASRCAEVVQRLLDFSRPSTRKKVSVDVGALMEDVRKMLSKFLPTTIRVETEVAPDTGPFQGNKTEIETVLLSLAANARDAMPEGGCFNLRVAKTVKDGRLFVRFEVSDTGSGIPADLLTRIYEPFFTTKPKGHGTGLGLAMVFSIVKNHGGEIEVSSQVGVGTRFGILLPAAAQAPGAQEKADQEKAPFKVPGNGHGRMILIVDDEPALRTLAKVLVQRLGYQPLTASDGEEALGIFREKAGQIAAVLLDMTMPKMTGKEVLSRLLSIDPAAKVVLVSGFTAEGTYEELIAAGACDFIPKPYTTESLSRSLERIL